MQNVRHRPQDSTAGDDVQISKDRHLHLTVTTLTYNLSHSQLVSDPVDSESFRPLTATV